MEYKIIELLRESELFSYDNFREGDKVFVDQFYNWITDVKELIINTYVESSEPFKLINEVDFLQFSVNEDSFTLEKAKVEMALKKCLYEQQAVKSQSATFLEKIVYAIMNLFK
ncbi:MULTISPECIES: hypothetical protein [Myroides]|uniref:hypothetical protein n=1 Tax=Myroides TaxID=76831 RepID=UPI0013034D3E|nr:hypothetical protein [Myroides phaeus]